MRLADVAPADLRRRLKGPGLVLRTPPFVARIQADSDKVVEGLRLCYDSFEVADDDEFVDFHLAVHLDGGLRGWLNPTARFSSDGRRSFSSLAANQAFHMIEWGLNWAVTANAHQYLVYHAAVLAQGDRAVLMPAPPGSGKSTLSAALANRGWRLLSDELALCDPVTGELIGMARPVNLKNAAIDLIRRFAPQARLTAPVPSTAKGTLALMRPPQHSIDNVNLRATPTWIVTPQYRADTPAFLMEANRADTMMLLAEQSFNYDIHGRRGFETTADLVDRCQCLQFTYSSLEEACEVFDGLAAA